MKLVFACGKESIEITFIQQFEVGVVRRAQMLGVHPALSAGDGGDEQGFTGP